MALPHNKKSERTTSSGVSWLTPEEKTKASRKKCIFKNHLIDNDCTYTDCLLYPKLSCRNFTYTNNADRSIPRCEHLLNRTRCYPPSNLECNPFQTPLKEIVAQEIRLCAEERCSNYSLRYVFNNSCQCDMNTLKGLLPSYQGYDNICCKRKNYSRKLTDIIDVEKLRMFQTKLAEAVETTKRSYDPEPYGTYGSLYKKCKSLASNKVQLSKDSNPSAETNYLFRNQLMEKAKRKSVENNDLIMTQSKKKDVDFQNSESLMKLDASNIFDPPGSSVKELENQTTANGALSRNEETMHNSDNVVVVSTTSITMPSTMHDTGTAENNTADFQNNTDTGSHIMADETKAVSGEEGGASAHNVDMNAVTLTGHNHDAVAGTEAGDVDEYLSEGGSITSSVIDANINKETTEETEAEAAEKAKSMNSITEEKGKAIEKTEGEAEKAESMNSITKGKKKGKATEETEAEKAESMNSVTKGKGKATEEPEAEKAESMNSVTKGKGKATEETEVEAEKAESMNSVTEEKGKATEETEAEKSESGSHLLE